MAAARDNIKASEFLPARSLFVFLEQQGGRKSAMAPYYLWCSSHKFGGGWGGGNCACDGLGSLRTRRRRGSRDYGKVIVEFIRDNTRTVIQFSDANRRDFVSFILNSIQIPSALDLQH